jgi:hypothetical protein
VWRLAAQSGRGEAMPKKKEPELTPAEQLKRFKQAAKAAGVTDDEQEFEKAFHTVAKIKPPDQKNPRPKK